MARFAQAATIRNGQVGMQSPESHTVPTTDPTTSGDVFIAFDNTRITSVSALRKVLNDIAGRCLGFGGLTP